MRILVTGAAGFIGSHVCERLLARGHEVAGYDRFDPFYDPKHKERNVAPLLSHPRFSLERADILDAPRIAAAARGAAAVCHLAAIAGVRPSIADPTRYARVNCEGTANVLQACRTAGARLVFASSSSVYGARSAVPFHEDDPCDRPTSPYAATKRAGELLCQSFAHASGLRGSALRFFTVYGPRQRPEMAIAKFVHAVEEGRPVALYGDGTSARDYTFVDDTVSGVVAALERDAPGFAIYNLGGTRPVGLRDLIARIERAVGKPATIEWHPDQPGDVPLTCASIDRARADLGYEPSVTLDEGLARYVAWMRSTRDA